MHTLIKLVMFLGREGGLQFTNYNLQLQSVMHREGFRGSLQRFLAHLIIIYNVPHYLIIS